MLQVDGFEAFVLADGLEKTVYRRGEGPPVVLIHELPGLSEACIALARRLSGEGFTVYMPLLFGEPGKDYGLKPLLWPCVWREFSAFRSRAPRPVTEWLRALARRAKAERPGQGVGAIGMCYTGGFALSMMMEDSLIAPVLSQPSPPGPPWDTAGLGLTEEEWACARRRSEDEAIPVLGFRFTGDALCREARFQTLREGFGERFRAVEVPGSSHSVLTHHFDRLSPADQERVWGELTGFLRERLKPD